ncbi:hypothetical protein D9M73_136700 [compost metagenome]
MGLARLAPLFPGVGRDDRLRHRRDRHRRGRIGAKRRQRWHHAGIGQPLRAGADFAEMHRERTIRRAQSRQNFKERLQPLRHAGRHHAGCDLLRTGLVARHCEDEGARAPRATIALAQQRLDLRQRKLTLAGNPQRQGIASLGFLISPRLQRQSIFALGALLLADQIIGQASIGGKGPRVSAKRFRLRKVAQGIARTLGRDEQRPLTGFDARVTRIDPLGACKESGGGGIVAELQRQFPGADQRLQIVRVGGQRADFARKQIGIG